MIYKRIAPPSSLTSLIESFWLVDGQGNQKSEMQKIIPDGYPEMIFHYADPYEINISGTWEKQAPCLLSGQISNHFFLRNTGESGMIGVKFMPMALTQLFDLNMSSLKDKVVSIQTLPELPLKALMELKPSLDGLDAFISGFQKILKHKNLVEASQELSIEGLISHLMNQKGMLAISELCNISGKSERQIERLFSKYIGLSPKFYSRIIRFSHIFELMESEDNSWSDLVYKSGFYDQSHFIKNFKEFTGEDPSSYGFEEKNMANFHLRK